jgi:hypothetical protein
LQNLNGFETKTNDVRPEKSRMKQSTPTLSPTSTTSRVEREREKKVKNEWNGLGDRRFI